MNAADLINSIPSVCYEDKTLLSSGHILHSGFPRVSLVPGPSLDWEIIPHTMLSGNFHLYTVTTNAILI